MVLRLKIILLTIMLLGSISILVGQGIQQAEAITGPIVEEMIPIDEIALKQREMLDTIVYVQTRSGRGSGTIIDYVEIEEVFKYYVLTNAHVVSSRFITQIQGVNSLTGKPKVRVINTGCGIITFDHQNRDWDHHIARVVAEDITNDLAILSFVSDQELVVAKVANDDMLKQIRIFDEIFAVGCQLGRAPSPTVGIISQILTESNNGQERMIYSNTAQISPGSSGGALFKKYVEGYYLIGIPHRVSVAPNRQSVYHLSHAISMLSAKDFINRNLVSYP